MTDLTKKEAAYFMFSAIAGLSVMLGVLAFWASTQESCWDKYATEQAAIEACEQ